MQIETEMSNQAKSSENLSKFLIQYPAIKSQMEFIVIGLRRREISGAQPCAKVTIQFLKNILSSCKFTSVDNMMLIVRNVGKELIAAVPSELTVGNLVRRVLFIIRDEYAKEVKLNKVVFTPKIRTRSIDETLPSNQGENHKLKISIPPPASTGSHPTSTASASNNSNSSNKPIVSDITGQLSLEKILSQKISEKYSDFSYISQDLEQNIIAVVEELDKEVDNVYLTICKQAQELIHNDECILIYGYSAVIEKFLKAAAKKRRFYVIVAEASPSLEGHKLADSLAKIANIAVTLIPDSNIYAFMSRVNKVIFSPVAVMADGGAIGSSGHLMVAVAADMHSVPMVGIASDFMLTPLFSHNQSTLLTQLLSPEGVIPYNTAISYTCKMQVTLPAYDYVPPELVDLYVTNDGNNPPSYIYRQLGEYYHPLDTNL